MAWCKLIVYAGFKRLVLLPGEKNKCLKEEIFETVFGIGIKNISLCTIGGVIKRFCCAFVLLVM